MRRPLPTPPRTLLPDLPVLDTLPFFEAAARLGSFQGAGKELGVTAAAVAYRVKSLETHLGVALFSRRSRGVQLNGHGWAYLEEVQHILAELRRANEHLRGGPRSAVLRLITVEVVVEKWLMPRLPDFNAAHPDLTIEFETDQGAFAPEKREFDVWVAFTDRVRAAPHSETLFEETLVPVCSPALLAERGRPGEPRDLHRWPLLYDLVWARYWSHWFAHPPHAARRPGAGFGLPPLQRHGAGRRGRPGRRPRTHPDDCRGARTGHAGPALRQRRSRAGPLCPLPRARRPGQARRAGVARLAARSGRPAIPLAAARSEPARSIVDRACR